MEKHEQDPPSVQHFYVDEAGDTTLFDKKGRVIVGEPGVSHCFMVGLAIIPDPKSVRKALDDLRSEMLTDPFLNRQPSMQPESSKTAVAFHAKDDLPEVRHQVFRLLPSFGAKVIVAVRRKSNLADDARLAYELTGEKLTANDIYDGLVRQIFQNVLHKSHENRIVFARRGKSDRTEALTKAINQAKLAFAKKWGERPDRPTRINSASPSDSGGLQVIDYYLWALQRLFERREGRYYRPLEQQYRLIMDIDDKRGKPYGEWYNDRNRLEEERLKPITEG
jgi:hypothetical protein